MGWEVWTHRRRRLAGMLARARIPLFGGRHDLPYCGHLTPFPSDYVVPDWAPFVLPSLRPVFEGRFVDVGVNIGQTMLLVKNADAAWEYVGFEPNPISFVVAQQVVRANGLHDYRLVPAGL